MLDVHPAHHAATTWRDFVIHIATIVLGLLIAIGLEQIVENVHLRFEAHDTREQLDRDLIANRADARRNAQNWRLGMAELQNNLDVLQFIRTHPGTSQDNLPGDLRWVEFPKTWHTAAWSEAEANGRVRLLPLEVANHTRDLYAFLDVIRKQNLDDWNAFNAAHQFDFVDGDPTHLTANQIDGAMEATEAAMNAHMLVGYSLALLDHVFPELDCPLTYADLEHFRHDPAAESHAVLIGPHQRTNERLLVIGQPIF